MTVRRHLTHILVVAGLPFLAWACWDYKTISEVRNDLSLALTPVLRLPLEELPVGHSVDFEYRWPSDEQWLRIMKNWDSPSFMIACFKTPLESAQEYVGLPLEPLQCRVLRRDSTLSVLSREQLVSYPEIVSGAARLTAFSGFKFMAAPGDRLTIDFIYPKGAPLPEGMLVVSPYLPAGRVKDLGVENAVHGVIALGKSALGGLLVATGLVLTFLDRRKMVIVSSHGVPS